MAELNSTKYNELDLTKLTYNALRTMCKNEGVKANGKKVELINSLKNIPELYVDDTFSESSNSTLKDAQLCSSRPVFGDISLISVNSTLEDRSISRSIKKLSLDECGEKENMEKPGASSSRSNLQSLSNDVRNKENRLEQLLKQLEGPAQRMFDMIREEKTELEQCRSAGDAFYQRMLDQRLEEQAKAQEEKRVKEVQLLTSTFKNTETNLRNKLQEVNQSNSRLDEEKAELTISNRTLTTNNERLRNLLKEREREKSQLQTLFHDLQKKLKLKETEIKRQEELMQVMQHTSNDNGLMESVDDELTCSICQELFVSAATLPCAHSFCEMCLRSWFKTKKSCPVCRADVKLKVVFSVSLDSVVECLVEKSSEDVKRKRTILLRERNEEKRTADSAIDPLGVRKMFYKAGDIVPNNSVPASSAASAGAAAGAAVGVGVINVNANRRRSRSQSPARGLINRGLGAGGGGGYQPNRHQYIRCYNCGNNHHIRNCPYPRDAPYRR